MSLARFSQGYVLSKVIAVSLRVIGVVISIVLVIGNQPMKPSTQWLTQSMKCRFN